MAMTVDVDTPFKDLDLDGKKERLLFIVRLQPQPFMLIQALATAEGVDIDILPQAWARTDEGKAFWQALRGLETEGFIDIFQDQNVQLRT